MAETGVYEDRREGERGGKERGEGKREGREGERGGMKGVVRSALVVRSSQRRHLAHSALEPLEGDHYVN